MDTLAATRTPDAGPISPDWTTGQLLDWLSEDARQHDATLREPLARIEALLTDAHWAHTPSTVALIRSIAGAVRDEPALRSIRIRNLGLQPTPGVSERIPQFA
ncbi:hypothetical protein RN51_00084 [Microbacterium oxydans]|uniref:Uncharacterized protein n=1 Tax=Microbacterium oxydans TaxID=82380 RepID=A0A0F0L2M5_9MICO|nr:hypothetical protein [Microbacterium oxydans]KJL26944.1 hypothetical protein RN51_00084 [Microbacterium oxydans]